MKKYLLIISLLISTICSGQILDSLVIYTPLPKAKKVLTMDTIRGLEDNLEELNGVYKTNLFIVRFYVDNGQTFTKVYYRKKEKPKQIII